MNKTNSKLTAAIDAIAREAYESYIRTLIGASGLGIILYATLSKLPHEIEYIWLKPFSLPTLLYIFARYATLIMEVFTVLLDSESLGRKNSNACNVFANVVNSMGVLSLIGFLGLIFARAYALCQGNKILITALVLGFLSQLSLYLYDTITFPRCTARLASVFTAKDALLLFVTSIVDLLGDTLVLIICIWRVWGTRKLKREAGIQNSHSLVSIILKQSILRCCFVVLFGIIRAVIFAVSGSSESPIADSFTRFQNVLSSVLVADFTLDLRRCNSAKIEASNISLSTLRFSNALQHAHQSLLVEMATPEERNAEDEDGDYNDGDTVLGSTNDMEIHSAEV